MKNGLLFLLLIFFSCTESSPKFSKKDIYYIERDKETGWFRVHNKQNKWGFIDKDSSIVIPFEYDFLNPFENGLAYAKNGRKEFFITKKNLKLEGDFDEVRIFSFGLAGVRKNRKWGFIDEKGKLIIQPIYDKIQYFTVNGLCPVVKNGKSGFIDKTGKEIIPIIYDDARSQQLDDIVIVQKNKRWAFFDNKGKQLSDFVFDEVFSTEHYDFSKDIFDKSQSTYFKNGAVLVRNGKNYEFINEKIEPAFPNNKFDSATVFDAFKNAIVKRNGKYGMIKSDGKIKVPLEYNFIEPYDSNHGNYSEYFNARKGKVYSIFNKNLKKIGESLEPIYNNFRTDNPTISFKNLKGKYGVIDKNGNVKVPFLYDEELRFEGNKYAIAIRNGKSGIIDSNGKELFPFNFDEIYELEDVDKTFIFSNKKGDKVVSLNGKVLLSDYENIHPIFYDHSKFIVKKNKKFGIVDISNKILTPIIYSEISDWVEYGPENRHIVKLGSKSGMLEYKTFKEKIPAIYDFVFVARDKVFVGKNKKYGIIDLNNRIICPLIYDELKLHFGDGLGFGDDKIYTRKANQYFEIDINGKIVKSVTKSEFLNTTKLSRIEVPEPPPPPKIK